MVDKVSAVLAQYEMEILATHKGRGSTLVETSEGMKILKEYSGPLKKLDIMDAVLNQLKELGFDRIDQMIRNKEGELYTRDMDGKVLILKSTYSGRECNVRVREEIMQAVRELGRLHNALEQCNVEHMDELTVHNEQEEMLRHNREMIHIYRYLRKVGDRTNFEQELLHSFPYYIDLAKETYANAKEEKVRDENRNHLLSHGDYQYHNVIVNEGNMCITNFEKMNRGGQVGDLYLFFRKALEKYNWSVELAEEIINNYQKERQLVDYERKELYDRVKYPEKFWKIANYYMNSRKSWQPEKNREKLQRVLSQESEKVKVLAFLKITTKY